MAQNRNAYFYSYHRDHYKRITVDIPKNYYEKHLKPAIQESGLSMNGYIRALLDKELGLQNIPKTNPQEKQGA